MGNALIIPVQPLSQIGQGHLGFALLFAHLICEQLAHT